MTDIEYRGLGAPESGSLDNGSLQRIVPEAYENQLMAYLSKIGNKGHKYMLDIKRQSGNNPKGGTGKFISNSKRAKARKNRKKKSR